MVSSEKAAVLVLFKLGVSEQRVAEVLESVSRVWSPVFEGADRLFGAQVSLATVIECRNALSKFPEVVWCQCLSGTPTFIRDHVV